MQTATTAPVNAKINTIQPIEGAKGNIALFYYQGKYPIYKSLDDGLFHAKSIIDAFNGSNGKTKKINHWYDLVDTKEYIAFVSRKSGIPTSELIVKKKQQNTKMQYLDGTYLHHMLMLDLARWLSKELHYEMMEVFGDKAEIDRLNADINHKQSTIDGLKQDIARIKEQNDELLTVNRKMCNQLETIKVTLSTLVENVSELKNHVTSNKLCKYVIVLYKDEERSDEKFTVIKPFCGLKENRPKIDKLDILFEREVSCSIDSFKEALSVLEERYIVKIHYRSITIKNSDLEDFIDEFRVELRRRSTTIGEICCKLDRVATNISMLDSKVNSIDKRLAAYDKFIANYGANYAFVKRVLDGEITCKNGGKLYQLQLSMKKQQPYINMNGSRLYMPLNVFHKRYL